MALDKPFKNDFIYESTFLHGFSNSTQELNKMKNTLTDFASEIYSAKHLLLDLLLNNFAFIANSTQT